jgi:hypothetical protein
MEYELENKICEAIDCTQKAVKTIEVNAGIYGKIPLLLCNKCIVKFNETK